LFDDLDVHFKIQVVNTDGIFHVGFRGGNRHQRHNHVAFFDVIFDPLFVDGNITFQKIEARIMKRGANPLRPQIHPEYLPIGLFGQDSVDQMMSDKAVHAQY
jgi:hypothetical protein